MSVKLSAIIFPISGENPGINGCKNIPIPTSAKALFKLSENHEANPANVPNRGPRLLWVKKYTPPDFGIAVASSAFDNIAGIIIIAAKI